MWNTVAFTCDFKNFTRRGLVNMSKHLNIPWTFKLFASQDCALSCWALFCFLSGAQKVNLVLSVGTENSTAHISDNENIYKTQNGGRKGNRNIVLTTVYIWVLSLIIYSTFFLPLLKMQFSAWEITFIIRKTW